MHFIHDNNLIPLTDYLGFTQGITEVTRRECEMCSHLMFLTFRAKATGDMRVLIVYNDFVREYEAIGGSTGQQKYAEDSTLDHQTVLNFLKTKTLSPE